VIHRAVDNLVLVFLLGAPQERHKENRINSMITG
jgi:hypothetical protein